MNKNRTKKQREDMNKNRTKKKIQDMNEKITDISDEYKDRERTPEQKKQNISDEKTRRTKKIKVKQALTLAICLSGIGLKSAFAACAISPNDSYEYIQSISINGSALLNGAAVKNGDVLEMTVEQAVDFFDNIPAISSSHFNWRKISCTFWYAWLITH